MTTDGPRRRRKGAAEPEILGPQRYGDEGTEPRYQGDRWPWDAEIAEEFLARVRAGQPVQRLSAEAIWPGPITLWLWREHVPEFRVAYFDALEEAKKAEEEAAQEAFDAVRWIGWAVLYDRSIDPKRAKVALDAFKWLAQRGHPAKFGNNVDITNSDGSLSLAKIERYVIGATSDE